MTRAEFLVKSAVAFMATLMDFSESSSSSMTPKGEIMDPLLLRIARGDAPATAPTASGAVTPVWMMRQAGRHMKAYRDLVARYPTFRERSETPSVALEISLQPFQAYGVDGVILFSDILTPLPAMGVDFGVSEGGKISIEPTVRSKDDFKKLKKITSEQYDSHCPFVGQVLRELRKSVHPTTTVLGFVGLPFTLATYLVEGKTGVATNFEHVRRLVKQCPDVLHQLLQLLAHNVAEYALYQIRCGGAHVIQVFDSWAGYFNDEEYDKFCAPYQKQVIATIKQKHPDTPVIIYMAPGTYSKNGQRLARLVQTGADVISVDHTVDMAVARTLIPESIGLQGNLDPKLLRDGPMEEIVAQTKSIIDKAAGRRHIMNLGHGIDPTTPEKHAFLFVKTAQEYKSASS